MDGAGAQLDLLGRAVLEQLAGFDLALQGRVEAQHAVDAEHVRDEVVGEGGEAVEVARASATPMRSTSAAAIWARLKKGTGRPS